MWQDALTSAYLRKLEGLSLSTRTAGSATGGQRRSRARGGSVEFADFREYAAGDDTRRIDWSAFARFDKLFLRLFLDERDTLATVWLDTSASMLPKADEARQLAATVCYLALIRFDRAAICAVGDGLKMRSETFSGRAAFHRAVQFLDGLEFTGNTSISRAMRGAPPPAGGVSVLLSDLMAGDDWRQAVSFLAYCKQDAAVVQLLSPGELSPVMDGPVRLISAENEPALDVNLSPAVLEAYRRALDAFTQGIRAHCHAHGAAYLLADSSSPLDTLVFDGLARAAVVR